MTDAEWYEHVKAGDDAGWKLVWEKVVEPESKSLRSAELMKRYSITAGDLMGMLFDEMIGRKKIELFRNDGGSFQGWLRRYVRGYVLNADPNKHGEVSIDNAHPDADDGNTTLEVPIDDMKMTMNEVWNMTHLCFKDLWTVDPERAYIHLLKTRFFLSSEETKDFLDVSSAANVDQIFSRNIKYMRNAWVKWDKKRF